MVLSGFKWFWHKNENVERQCQHQIRLDRKIMVNALFVGGFILTSSLRVAR